MYPRRQGVAKNSYIAARSAEWQIPVGLELVAAGIMLLGCLTLPESTRWLLSQNRPDEAWRSLAWIRGIGTDSEDAATHDEFTETQAGLRAEQAAQQDFRLSEIVTEPANRLRFFVGPVMFIFQNTTGSSALAVFGPQYFKLLVGSTGTRDLLLTGLFGAVKVIACTFFIWVLAERFGRRTLLVGGSALMAVCMLITALIVDEIPTESGSGVTSAGRATVAMIYLDIMVSYVFFSLELSYCVLVGKSDASRFTTAPGAPFPGPTSQKSSPRASAPSGSPRRCSPTGPPRCASPLPAPT